MRGPMKDREQQWRETLGKIKNPVARRFFQAGKAFIEVNGPPFALEPGTAECAAWGRYFDRIGWCPVAFREMQVATQDGAKRMMTVPAQWPEWFDTGHADAA